MTEREHNYDLFQHYSNSFLFFFFKSWLKIYFCCLFENYYYLLSLSQSNLSIWTIKEDSYIPIVKSEQLDSGESLPVL